MNFKEIDFNYQVIDDGPVGLNASIPSDAKLYLNNCSMGEVQVMLNALNSTGEYFQFEMSGQDLMFYLNIVLMNAFLEWLYKCMEPSFSLVLKGVNQIAWPYRLNASLGSCQDLFVRLQKGERWQSGKIILLEQAA